MYYISRSNDSDSIALISLNMQCKKLALAVRFIGFSKKSSFVSKMYNFVNKTKLHTKKFNIDVDMSSVSITQQLKHFSSIETSIMTIKSFKAFIQEHFTNVEMCFPLIVCFMSLKIVPGGLFFMFSETFETCFTFFLTNY